VPWVRFDCCSAVADGADRLANAYLCPHCEARNRFNPADTQDGVVRCGACSKAFMLPDHAPPDEPGDLDTAIVDTRLDGDEVRPERPDHVAGSNVPTLLVYDRAPSARVGSETPTLIVTETVTDAVAVDPSPSKELKPPPVSEADTQPNHQVEASRRPTVLAIDAIDPSQRRTLAEAATVKPGSAPPAAVLRAAESQRSSARPQRTAPPPDVVARLAEKPPEPVLAGTQPTVDTSPDPMRIAAYGAAALLLLAVVSGSFYFAQSTTESRSEAQLMQWSVEQGAVRSKAVASAIRSSMLASRPDLARRFVRDVAGSGVEVVRADGSKAFVDGDWSSYQTALRTGCDEAALDAQSKRAQAVARTWMAGADPRLAGLGANPCATGETLPSAVPPVDESLAARLKEHAGSGGTGMSWVEGEAGARVQVVARPIMPSEKCAGCHAQAADGDNLGFVVVRADLSAMDKTLTDNRSTLRLTSGFAGLLALVVFFAVLRFVGRRREAT